MTKKRKLLLLAFWLIINLNAAVALDSNMIVGKNLSGACVACHNTDGNSIIPGYPKIAGQNQRYFIEQMFDFKKGAASGRSSPIMEPVAAKLTLENIKDLAAYFSTQTMSQGIADKKYLTVGQSIFRGGILAKGVPACSSCHDPLGMGNAEAGFPRVAGQNPDYTIAQLQAYAAGNRKNDINKIMENIAHKMNNEEIKAVASYMAGLQE